MPESRNILRTALRFKESTRRAERAYELWRKLVEDEGHTELENFQVQAMTAVGMVHAEIR